jgi:hypothetical protein
MTVLWAGAHLATDFGGLTVEGVNVGPDGRRYARLHFAGRDKPYDVEVDDHNAIIDEPAFLDALMREWGRVGSAGIGRLAHDAALHFPPAFEVLAIYEGAELLVRYTGVEPCGDAEPGGVYRFKPGDRVA